MDEEEQNENKNENIKEELYTLYKIILKNTNSTSDSPSNNISDISSYNTSTLLNNIKKSIIEIILFNKNYKENLYKLENIIRKLEIDIKYYLKNLFHYKIQNNSLEMKLNAYSNIEKDYEELKEKVKYEGGKFMENDRKDNEIMILRNENSKIKKEIIKLEKQKIILGKEINDYKEKIAKLENNSNNITNKKLKRNNFNYSNLQHIINFTNNNYINNNKILGNLYSPKNNKIYFDHSRNKFNNKSTTLNTNIFKSNYNKINKESNSIFNFKKNNTRNKSISVGKQRESNESKTTSFNSNYINNINKSENKQNSSNKITKKNYERITSAKNIKYIK